MTQSRTPCWRPTRRERKHAREQLGLQVDAAAARQVEATAATKRVLRLLWDEPDAIPHAAALLQQRGARLERPFEAALKEALTRQLVSEREIVRAVAEHREAAR